MTRISTMQIEEKELAICLIPISSTNEKMAVYIPKLMNNLPSDKVYEKNITIDYTIIKNNTNNLKKKVKECNYIYTNPYLENNISPPIYAENESCFIRFLYTDIKQAYYLSENTEKSSLRTSERKVISVSDGKDGSYDLILDSESGIIELTSSNNNFGTSKNSFIIDQKNDSINLITKECNLSGILKINNKSLDDIIEEKLNERLEDIIKILNKKDGNNDE